MRSSQYHSASSHRSNSKESLWTSSQSSPNSNLRESFYSIKSNESPTSSNTSSAGSTCSSSNGGISGCGGGATLLTQNTNLWESPLVVGASSKLTLDAASSYANQLNKISNIWEIPSPATNVASICNSKPIQQHQQPLQLRNGNGLNASATSFLGQNRDLLFNDLWSNNDSCSATLNSSATTAEHHQHPQHNQYVADGKLQNDTIGSIWRTTQTPSINGASRNNNKLSSAATCIQTGKQHLQTQNQQQQQRPLIGANASFFTNTNDTNSSSSISSATAAAATSGSSSCMQLFSEEFLNYLNMIN